MASVTALMFLGTPHHGTNLAKILNKLLTASIVGPTPKQYVADLAEDSPMIEDLNEQFRHFLPLFNIASFYETRYITIGFKKMVDNFPFLTYRSLIFKMIVEKQSSIIGCANEVSQPLDADHHELCKYEDKNDKNYISVKKTLKSLVSSLTTLGKLLQSLLRLSLD